MQSKAPTTLYRYGQSLNTHDLLKILAVLLMIIDHIGWYVLHDAPILRLLGRTAAPLFFFLIGYSGKVHINAYLIIYGVILSITGGLLTHPPHFWIDILLNFVLLNFLLHYFPLERLTWFARLAAFTACVLFTPIFYPYLEYGFLGYLIAYAARSIALKESTCYEWLAAALGVYGLYEAWVFGYAFRPFYIACFITLLAGLYYLFSHYEMRQVTAPQTLVLPGLIISRYSLHIYFYHVLLLQFYIVLTSVSTFY